VTVEASVVRTVEAFAALAGEWDALAARHRDPLVEHDWFLACARTLHPSDALRVVVLRQAGALCAAAPLAMRRERGIERLEILGMRVLHEPSGLIYRDEASLAALLDAVRRLGRPVVLQRVDESGPVERVAREVLGSRSWLLGRPTGPTVRVPLDADWATFQARLSGRLRKWLRRARSLAEADGAVRIEKIGPGAAEVDAHLAAFATLEAAGWKGRRQSALLMKAALGAFFADYVRRAADRGTLRVWYLHVGPRLAAAQISLEAHGVLWVLKIAYDEALARLSPGLQLTSAVLEDAVRLRLTACEFIGSADDWKQRFRGELRPLRLVLIYPRSPRGAVALGVDAVAHAARALRERFARRSAAPTTSSADHEAAGAEPAGGRA
jgi:CelD/BcsL family acetyltransferase involved in cellulose biosynthesis